MDNLLDWLYSQIVGFLGNFFAEMGNMGVELFEMSWVQSVVLFFNQLGWALFGVSLFRVRNRIFDRAREYPTDRPERNQRVYGGQFVLNRTGQALFFVCIFARLNDHWSGRLRREHRQRRRENY